MRVTCADGREVVATDEALASATLLDPAMLRDAQHVNLSFNALSSLQGLETARCVRNLNVSHNAIASLRGVESLVHLRRLRCSANRIADLSWLTSLPALEELWVDDNLVETPQIAHLAAIKTLHALVLHPNPCTNLPNYVSFVVKAAPWIGRIDRVVVDEPLRQQSRLMDERDMLSSAATDVSEISLLTSRTADNEVREEESRAANAQEETATQEAVKQAVATVVAPMTRKKTKRMAAEELMRAFPVQDFVPADQGGTLIRGDKEDDAIHIGGSTSSLVTGNNETEAIDPSPASWESHAEQSETKASPTAIKHEEPHGAASASSIANAVMSLPLFDKESKKRSQSTPQRQPKTKAKASGKPTQPPAPIGAPDPALIAFNQPEWTLLYPNSTVAAVQIRCDGAAVAKWPNGSIAVSIDRERDGFRCYAAHKDGGIALSFDADGVGFVNYHPSGRMMISTSSSGDGLFFSSDGSTICRQWDSRLNMKDDKWQPTHQLTDDQPDGSLLTKLSDGLGVRLRLRPREEPPARPSVIDLSIFFAPSGTGVRHTFCNWINRGESTATACDVLFTKAQVSKPKKPAEPPRPSHLDTLSGIRAAVAKLG